MRQQRTLRVVPIAAVAAAGVLVAHWLTYLAALPQVHVRDVVLAATGHGYWTGAVRLVVALAGCGLAALLCRIWVRKRTNRAASASQDSYFGWPRSSAWRS
jgi:hypothetical protein